MVSVDVKHHVYLLTYTDVFIQFNSLTAAWHVLRKHESGDDDDVSKEDDDDNTLLCGFICSTAVTVFRKVTDNEELKELIDDAFSSTRTSTTSQWQHSTRSVSYTHLRAHETG